MIDETSDIYIAIVDGLVMSWFGGWDCIFNLYYFQI